MYVWDTRVFIKLFFVQFVPKMVKCKVTQFLADVMDMHSNMRKCFVRVLGDKGFLSESPSD